MSGLGGRLRNDWRGGYLSMVVGFVEMSGFLNTLRVMVSTLIFGGQYERGGVYDVGYGF